jgi:hypothetical protein
MIKRIRVLISILIFHPLLGFANPSINAYFELKKTEAVGSKWHLEVKQMPLNQALEKIAMKSDLVIHYSDLPEVMVNLDCVGRSMQTALTCLLKNKADFVVRYSRNIKNHIESGHIAEVWVLGTSVNRHSTSLSYSAQNENRKTDKQLAIDKYIEEEKLQKILKMTASDKSIERAKAMGRLLEVGHDGNLDIKETLEKGLHDEDPQVRSQAVSSLTHRVDIDKEKQLATIREAMQDDSNIVRMTAVDGITVDVDLLLQAINDEDELVRSLAQDKFNKLNAQALNK